MAANQNGSYAGKVAFVTGAGSGIGRATALAFAREGASVVVADASEQGNRETAHMIEELGGRTLAVRCDVTRAGDVRSVLDRTIETFGHLDVAFNNAGVEQEEAATGEIAEEELEIYLGELKKQTDNVRVLLASIEAELSERRERTALTDTTHAWLLSLRKRLEEVEEDTPEGFEKRKQLVGLLVESISLGKSQQEGRAEVQITYRFGPPPASDAESEEDLSMPVVKNGSRS